MYLSKDDTSKLKWLYLRIEIQYVKYKFVIPQEHSFFNSKGRIGSSSVEWWRKEKLTPQLMRPNKTPDRLLDPCGLTFLKIMSWRHMTTRSKIIPNKMESVNIYCVRQ